MKINLGGSFISIIRYLIAVECIQNCVSCISIEKNYNEKLVP
jgi:hypothetical protein